MSPDDGDKPETTAEPSLGGQRLQASRDNYAAGQDMQIDKSSGQHVQVHVHPPHSRQWRPWLITTGVIGTVAVLLIGVLVAHAVLAPSRAPAATPSARTSPTIVQLLGNDVFFSDPSVQRELLRLGLVVKQTLRDLRCTNKDAIAGYDISDTSQQAATCYQSLAQKAGKAPNVYSPYGGLMVIITYKPIVALLERLHVASEVNGITVFNVARYLKVFASGMRWTEIPGNTTYPNQNRILLWSTDPKQSNLGAMLADIAYAAQTGGDPPTSIGPHDPHVPVIRNLFTELGRLQNFSVDLLNQVLAGVMGEYPMAMVYESQYLSAVLTHRATDPSLTVMYPTPDVSTEDTLVAWTPAGKKLIDALKLKPMITLLEDEGYRTLEDEAGFVKAMARKHITVPDLDNLEKTLQFSPLPTPEILMELINAVAKS